ESYPTLRRYYAWFAAFRDGNRNGLFEYGSTPTGRAHDTHTKQGAMNESGMDNMPIFDDTVFNPAANTLEFEEPGHNSLLVLEGQMLARIARELGHEDEADALERSAAALAARISEELWDPDREIFAGRYWSGGFAPQLSPTSFFPLVAGAATPEQTETLIQKHLLNESEFWGELPLPSTPFDDPISQENSYWRGRIWPPLNFFTWEGLRRSGRSALATELAERSWQMFRAEWEAKRHCHENFHIRDPQLHESPDSDPFYSWGALIPMMRACESADVSPWDGLTLGGAADDCFLPLPGRCYTTRIASDRMEVRLNSRLLFTVSPPVRITHLEAEGRIRFRLRAEPGAVHEVEVPADIAASAAAVHIDGRAVDAPRAERPLVLPAVTTTVDLLLDESGSGSDA
ncbi:MAG: trehalase family glycosidase, partial [Gaiellaceae bacterium]